MTVGILAILFKSFGFITPKYFKIIWFSNLWTLSVPYAGYSRNTSYVFQVYLISTFLFQNLMEIS
jgi:hypothetical protein